MTARRSLLRALALMAAVMATALHAAEPPPAPAPWRVLLMIGGDMSLPAAQLHDRSLRATLQALAPGPVTFFVESIDAQRFDARSFEAESVAFLAKKYAAQPVDLVVATGDVTLDFVHRNHARLWPKAPVIFSAVSSALIVPDSPLHDYPYLTWKLDVQGTLDIIRAIQPAATRLVVLGGTSAFDQAQINEAMDVARQQDRWSAEVWNTFTLPDLVDKLSRANTQTAVLFTTMFRDASGVPVFPADALEKLAAQSGAPIYGMYGTYIGKGAAAGLVIDYQEMGRRAAEMAADLLRGKPVALAATQQTIQSHCVADYAPIAAHQLKLAGLPADCEVRNLPRNLWTQYRAFVLAALAVIVLQAITIGALLAQRRQRRAAELESSRQRTELSRAMRFAAMGELTASIAHEINQPLGAILSNAQAAELLLAKDAATPEQLRAILGDIRRDNERAHTVIKRLRALLSKDEVEHQPVHLHQAIGEVLSLLEPEARRRSVTIALELAAERDLLAADSVQLQQVVINLALNAMDAMDTMEGAKPLPRRLTLQTRNVESQLLLVVADTGCGIAESVRPTIFDSFYTTKKDGLGMGLAIVRAIVEAHHGTVTVTSQPGQGSTFTVSLPLQPQPP